MRSYLVQITSEIVALAKSGSISRARNLFDEMPHRDTVAWNAMISGYSHLGFHQEAISLFSSMRPGRVKPDHFTCTAVLSACAGLKDLQSGQGAHALVIVSGWKSLLPVNNALTDMYGKCLRAHDAYKVFEEMGFRNEVSWCSLLFAYSNVGLLDFSRNVFCNMPRRVVIAWNTMISSYAKWGHFESCLDTFKEMLEDSCCPDGWTLSAIMNACVGMSGPCNGYMLHGVIIQTGWNHAVEVNNSVLSFYVKFGEEKEILKVVDSVRTFNDVSWNMIIDAYMKIGNLEKACFVFQSMPEKKNLISWTSMIMGYMRNGHEERALMFFIDLMRNHIKPDDITLGSVLHACSNLATLGHGRMIHDHVIKSGFHAFSYIGNSLVNMYAKCGDIFQANRAFEDVLNKDLISWNTMLFASGLHGRSKQALRVYDEMVASGVKPDNVTFIGLLITCSHLGMIDEGLYFFESMGVKHGISPDIDHVACVVDMLARAGQLEKAKEFAVKYVKPNNVESSLSKALIGTYSSSCGSDLRMAVELGEQVRALKSSDEMSYVVLSNLYCVSGDWGKAEGLRKEMVDGGVRKTCGCSWIEVRNEVRCFVAGRGNSLACMEAVGVMVSVLECEMRHPDPISLCCLDGIT